MRLVIVGRESFIAQHVLRAAQAEHIEAIALPYDADDFGALSSSDTVINFSLHPIYKNTAYDEAFDCDLRIARVAAAAGAHSAMVSSRKVYPETSRWNASEDSPSNGDDSHYGRNKAITETRLLALSGGRATIFRLANICGYEYNGTTPRMSFFGIMQHSLKNRNVIKFDMHASTRRDFLPIEHCASALVSALKSQVEGVYNVGSGFPSACGDLAGWIIEGFGAGEIVVDPPVVRDEFFLNMEKWTAQFGHAPIGVDELRSYCINIGQKLKCEKSL